MHQNLVVSALKSILADYNDWSGKWVHFSNEPYLKINPKQFHSDPAGIYLFPEKFDPVGMWSSYRYKMIVDVPSDLNVLDLGTMDDDKAVKLYQDLMGDDAIADADKEIKNVQYSTPMDHAWDLLRNSDKFIRSPGKWNKEIRNLGYDAVFDDAKIIHPSEVQLIVLDPRKVKLIDLQDRTDTGYEDLIVVMDYLEEYFSEYGTVETKAPRKKKEWGETTLKGSISIEDEKGNSLSLSVYPEKPSRGTRSSKIMISLMYSSPRLGFGAGAQFDRDKRDFGDIDKNMQMLVDKIFLSRRDI